MNLEQAEVLGGEGWEASVVSQQHKMGSVMSRYKLAGTSLGSVATAIGLLMILAVTLVGCWAPTRQDALDVREAAFREILPTLEPPGLVFIAFDYHDDMLKWDPPPAGFTEKLSGLNDRITLRSISEIEIVHPPNAPLLVLGFRNKSGATGSVCSVNIIEWKGRREVIVKVDYGSGSLSGYAYKALMKKQKGEWSTIRTWDRVVS